MQRVDTVWQLGLQNCLGIYLRAETGDHETVRAVKQFKYSWLSGVYVFPLVVIPQILTF